MNYEIFKITFICLPIYYYYLKKKHIDDRPFKYGIILECLFFILLLYILAVKTSSPPPGLEPGSSDCRSGALPTKLQSETSFHRLCCAFIVSVSLHSPPDEPHVVSLVVKNLEQRIRNLHSGSVETIIANC